MQSIRTVFICLGRQPSPGADSLEAGSALRICFPYLALVIQQITLCCKAKGRNKPGCFTARFSKPKAEELPPSPPQSPKPDSCPPCPSSSPRRGEQLVIDPPSQPASEPLGAPAGLCRWAACRAVAGRLYRRCPWDLPLLSCPRYLSVPEGASRGPDLTERIGSAFVLGRSLAILFVYILKINQ